MHGLYSPWYIYFHSIFLAYFYTAFYICFICLIPDVFVCVNIVNILILIPPIQVIFSILLHILLSMATFNFTAYPVYACHKESS